MDEQQFWNHVDDSDPDECWLWVGGTTPGGYGYYRPDKAAAGRAAHRVAWELTYGEIPDGLLVDHKCFVNLCVRPDHLRTATQKQNAENKRGARRDSKTGARNVVRDGDKYIVRVTHNGKARQYGRFSTIEQAAQRAAEVRAELFTYSQENT